MATLTLAALIKSGVLQPGKGVMSRDYLGTQFTADLLSDGKIVWTDQNAKENVCNTPTAFTRMVMRFVRKTGARVHLQEFSYTRIHSPMLYI